MSRPPCIALAARGLQVQQGERTVLDGMSLEFAPGRFTAIIGPNGSGKSTLLATLAGLHPARAGSVWLGDRSLADWTVRERARQLAWLGQQAEAEGELDVRAVVSLGRLPWVGLFGALRAEDHAAVDAALSETDTSTLATRRLSELSGGERQRVLIARALAGQTPVLLLDEPTTHLDAPHQRALLRSLQARAAQGGTVVAVLHELNLALAADQLVVLARGRIAAAGSPSEPAVRTAIEAAFGEAIRIMEVTGPDGPVTVAVPRP